MKRCSTPSVSGVPVRTSSRTTSSGTKDENDCSELRSKAAADCSCAISLIFETLPEPLSNESASTDFSSREIFSIGRDSLMDSA